jgi:hypothetical protein
VDVCKFQFIELINKATEIEPADASKRYPISRVMPGDSYLEFYVPSIRETMIAIRRKDGAIVTVLTHQVFSPHVGKGQQKINRQAKFLREKVMG